MTEHDAPDATLAIAPGCPHCPAVLKTLSDLLKQGRVGRLQVVNLAARPDFATAEDIRGVPWVSIGPFRMTGLQTRDELEGWIARAGSDSGRREYLTGQLGQGQLDEVTAACRRAPALLPALLQLAADLDTPFAVRIGVGAVLEDLGPAGLLGNLVDPIAETLGRSEHAQVRADAAHFLGLTGSRSAEALLKTLARDVDAAVREIATESLQALADDAQS